MTREEFFAKWEALYDGNDAEFLSDLDALLKAERERCADLAAGLHEHYAEIRHEPGDAAPAEWARACKYAAERIRSLA